MRAIPSSGTKPEMVFRSALHSLGCRYRLGQTVTVGSRRVTPDIVFQRARIMVFIDGCYWHGCPDHCRMPQTNSDYWERKIGGNVERDRRDNTVFSEDGWTVVRYWEHDDLPIAAARLRELLRERSGRAP